VPILHPFHAPGQAVVLPATRMSRYPSVRPTSARSSTAWRWRRQDALSAGKMCWSKPLWRRPRARGSQSCTQMGHRTGWNCEYLCYWDCDV